VSATMESVNKLCLRGPRVSRLRLIWFGIPEALCVWVIQGLLLVTNITTG
jgi:hypothetical protein